LEVVGLLPGRGVAARRFREPEYARNKREKLFFGDWGLWREPPKRTRPKALRRDRLRYLFSGVLSFRAEACGGSIEDAGLRGA